MVTMASARIDAATLRRSIGAASARCVYPDGAGRRATMRWRLVQPGDAGHGGQSLFGTVKPIAFARWPMARACSRNTFPWGQRYGRWFLMKASTRSALFTGLYLPVAKRASAAEVVVGIEGSRQSGEALRLVRCVVQSRQCPLSGELSFPGQLQSGSASQQRAICSCLPYSAGQP